MTQIPIEIGRVVLSCAGRDTGRHFIIVSMIDDVHVGVADGCLRKVDRPKKKKIRHLVPKPELIASIQVKLTEGKQIFDSELRKCLESAGYAPRQQPRKEGL